MCTSVRVTAQDGTVVVGRTMEFPNALGTNITLLPRGFRGVGTGRDADGLTWTAQHGLVGMDAFDLPGTLTDGMNERGLYAGLLYMPGFCQYTPADDQDPGSLLSIVDVVAYVLGTSADVDEAVAAMDRAVVWPAVFGPFGFPPPAHLVLHDATGRSTVVEWRDGTMELHDNPIGVACNWPHLDWHLTNLRNYISLSAANPAPTTIDGVELSAMGQGPGMRGLPGDASSPSRFVRATALTATLRPVPTGEEMERTVLHVLNNFDIPQGFVRDGDDAANDDHTLWSSVANLGGRRYVIRSYDNPVPQVIDLGTADFAPGPPRTTPIPAGSFQPLVL